MVRARSVILQSARPTPAIRAPLRSPLAPALGGRFRRSPPSQKRLRAARWAACGIWAIRRDAGRTSRRNVKNRFAGKSRTRHRGCSTVKRQSRQRPTGLRPLFLRAESADGKTGEFLLMRRGWTGVTVTCKRWQLRDGTLTASTIAFPSGGGAGRFIKWCGGTTPVTRLLAAEPRSLFSVALGSTRGYARSMCRLFLLHLRFGQHFTKTRAIGDWGDRRGIWIYPTTCDDWIWHPQIPGNRLCLPTAGSRPHQDWLFGFPRLRGSMQQTTLYYFLRSRSAARSIRLLLAR